MLWPRLDRHPAHCLRHSCEERESVVGVGDRLVCDTGSSDCHRVPGLVLVRGEVEIGGKDVIRSDTDPLDDLRFLDLHD